MRFLLDTNVCIDVLRGQSDVIGRLKGYTPDDCAVSTITCYELFVGVHKCRQPAREGQKVRELLATVHEITFDRAAAERAGELRAALEKEGQTIGPYDLLLAAQALSRDLTLVTANCDEYKRINDLDWEDWRRTAD